MARLVDIATLFWAVPRVCGGPVRPRLPTRLAASSLPTATMPPDSRPRAYVPSAGAGGDFPSHPGCTRLSGDLAPASRGSIGIGALIVIGGASYEASIPPRRVLIASLRSQ